LIGQTIGNYLVTQKLGEGGMGSVYLAEHPSIGKKVALKVLHSEFSTNQEVTARFFHEAKAVNDIGHPNIVDIVDFGILQAGHGREQLVYFIMEYLAGMTLSQLIRSEAPLPPERALSVALQVCDALAASHKCGIVHRDLKPDNIILLQRGRERDFVKLLDFGIAKLTGGSAVGSHRTRTGIVMGTPAYMSPEQCEGRDSVDRRTDVYALGIVLYEMLTGRVPFVGEGYGEILVQHLTQRPVPPSQFRMLPAHVEVVVLKALEKRADMRYPTMEEFMRAMSDPVGYVEAHGGVAGFLQRQLMPSNAPLPSVRLTPAPLTPLPGTLIAPSVPGVGPVGSGVAPSMPGVGPRSMPSMPGVMPGGPNIATPTPTTLGSATGQLQRPGGKAGYILAGLVIAGAAIAAIIAVAGKDKVPVAGSGNASGSAALIDDRGSAAATGSAAGAGTAAGTTGAATTGTGSTGTTGAGTGTTGATGTGSAAAATAGSGADGSAAATGTGTTGAGSDATGTAGTGSSGRGKTIVEPESPEISVTSSPSGAHVYVDNGDTGKTTPTRLSVPNKSATPVTITLRLRGYESFTFRSVDVIDGAPHKVELVKIKTSSPVAKCRTPDRAGCTRDSKGCCAPESSGYGSGSRPGQGNKAGSAQGSGVGDRDDLMKP
ncbi:MAG TPA: protein kinase, partial [Kofleriaceae bacterium]|nr:protein kinase [Kofleriaceae bacterium]